jgi:hypothetical protein
MKDTIEHEGKTLRRLEGTHSAPSYAGFRAEKIRCQGRAAIVRPVVVNGTRCIAVYAEDVAQ